MTKKVPLTQGKFALVSEEDFDRVAQFKWTAARTGRNSTFYAYRMERVDGKKTCIYMHRFILDPPPDMQVDHINHNGLDNRRENIRVVTGAENRWNQRKQKRSFSRFKGITPGSREGTFIPQICIYGKVIRFGTHEGEEYTAKLYDALSYRFKGDLAHLNFPEIDPEADRMASELLRRKGISA